MRLAVYWAPDAEHPLWSAGCRWLGRDPSDTDVGAPPPFAATAWRYGFHATLKAPMRLVAGTAPQAFCDAVDALAAGQADFEMPALQVDWLAGFLALRPVQPLGPDAPLRCLADQCVRDLDPWRAPSPSASSNGDGLDAVQQALLQRWGYPHVFGRWRFHMTLSDPHPPERQALQRRAEEHFADALARPLRAGGLAVFREDSPGVPLRLVRRCPLKPR